MKIAVLGTENSHAYAFAQLIKTMPKYADVEIVGVYGYDDAANQKLVGEGLAPYAAQSPHEFLGKADGILVTARHGDHHHEYALPYVQAGVPAFIDKPFAVELDKANELLSAAKESGALLCGGSSLKYLDEMNALARFRKSTHVVGGNVTAPINMVNPYGGFYFYAQHLIEILFSVFGTGIQSVSARSHGDENRVSVIFDYGAWDVTAQFYDSYTYSATVFSKEGCRHAAASDVSYCYEKELDDFVNMVRSGKMPHAYDSLMAPLKSPLSSGEAHNILTEIPPADSPAMVILSGSPPKAAMLSCIHFKAITWSSMP